MASNGGTPHEMIEVIAGGVGSRLQSLIDAEYPDLPKHLLPLPAQTPRRSTIVGNVVEDTLTAFRIARVHVRAETVRVFAEALEPFGHRVQIVPDTRLSGPLGPIASIMRETGKRVCMAGGDVCGRLTWGDLPAFHQTDPLPVTALFASP